MQNGAREPVPQRSAEMKSEQHLQVHIRLKFSMLQKAVIGLYYFHHAFNNPVDVCMVCMTVRTDCSPFLFASGYLLYTP